jgi:hypothetical protein
MTEPIKHQLIFAIRQENEVTGSGDQYTSQIYMKRATEVFSLDMIAFHLVWGNISYGGDLSYINNAGVLV